MTDHRPPADSDNGPATGPHDERVDSSAGPPPTERREAGIRVGPTSEETRRLVAESRLRQGLPARIDNPAVIESLAVFLRNALDTLEPGGPHPHR